MLKEKFLYNIIERKSRKCEGMSRKISVILGSIIIIGMIYIAYIHMKMYQSSHQEIPKQVDYIIVLGAKVNGATPSLSLQNRIDAAARFLANHEETIAIVSGGQGADEDISEAEVMRRGLVAQGIDEERVIIEDKSTSTYENIIFSKKLIPSHLQTGLLVTNDYHLYRASLIAKKEGLAITGLPAKTPGLAVVKSYVREYLAITKYYLENLR